MKRMRQESTMDKLYKFRSVILVISVPVILVSLVILFMPGVPSTIDLVDVETGIPSSRKVQPSPRGGSKSYAVIFDAGSSGSRVHVYCFNENLDLIPIGDDLELFDQLKPGLSAYADNPKGAANSLKPLLLKAERVMPKSLLKNTPVRVGATAGLRFLPGDAADNILEAVREFLAGESSLKAKPEWVTVLDGSQEGAYEWVTINYLLGNLGKSYANTVGIIDLGGGSVQMAYAISEKDAATSPKLSGGQSYVKDLLLKGTQYHLYVYSYLRYGLLAARAEILNHAATDAGHPCVLKGYHDYYKYSDLKLPAFGLPSGSSYEGCRKTAVAALNVNGSACTHMRCTFGGIWDGGAGDGQNNLFVASFFSDRAMEAGFMKSGDPVATVKPQDFEDAAKRACRMSLSEAKFAYADVDSNSLPYFCMDLVYQYTLLVDGFGLDPSKDITLVKKVQYKGAYVEAAWPLGSAIEVMSAS